MPHCQLFELWVVPWSTARMWVSGLRSVFLLRLLPQDRWSRGFPQWLLLLARQPTRQLLVVLCREVVHPTQRRRLSHLPQLYLLSVSPFFVSVGRVGLYSGSFMSMSVFLNLDRWAGLFR